MKKIGLALSGGGLRATLYHLGVVRFLRDAGILPQVTHITSVSGGSVLSAHLALNWSRYTGSESDFDAAAAELLAFIRLDVRNRILRRYPMASVVRLPLRLAGRSARQLTRTGLLEYHYEKHLYGDTSLFELPESPQLHILATNLNEGCLCSFNRDGLWVVRRQPDQSVVIERVHVGLATVPMAVTASSAFPGFFPPLVLTGVDVGASRGEFGTQAYTDGGVFDNLGVRMFRCLEPILKTEQCTLDGILVSAVGKSISSQNDKRAGGLIRTALRASEILMDRVWQLENDTFAGTAGFVFARATAVVEPKEDPTALHPEIQRKVAGIRTDLDRFSPLEMSSLIRHGYCVGRKACKSNSELFGTGLPADPPWDPFAPAPKVAPDGTVAPSADGPHREPVSVTRDARKLQRSAVRRIWTTLLDYRDWTSYVYVPIIVPILILLPYLAFKYYQHTHRVNRLVQSISHGSPDYGIMSQLLDGPMKPWPGETAEEVAQMQEPDFKGFEIQQDSRILDLRPWRPDEAGKGDSDSLVYGYRRLKILKSPDNNGREVFRVDLLAASPRTQVRFPVQQLRPKLQVTNTEGPRPGERLARYQAVLDFTKVPEGDTVDFVYEHYSPGVFLQRGETFTTLTFQHEVDAAEVTRWILMPEGKDYRDFRILRYKTGKPGTAEVLKGFTEYLAEDSSILAYKLISVKSGYTYEITWFYK
ncbi:MAG: patatin-like phospholipase family protein [Gemmataceae bacterium]